MGGDTGITMEDLANHINGISFEEAINGTSQLTNQIFDLADGLNQSQKATSDFQQAQERGEKDDQLKSYAEAYEALTEEIAQGRTNSNTFWNASKFFFGEDTLDQWDMSVEKIKKGVKTWKSVYEDADSAGYYMLQNLNKLTKAGKLVDETGKSLGSVSKNKQGGFDIL